jgi:integrase
VRVRLKGLHWSTFRSADGRKVTCYYAWRGGPRLRGEPGTPEFIADFNEAVARKVALPAGILLAVLVKFQQSDDFRGLADRTREDYGQHLKVIEREFGDMPVEALTDRRIRGVFLEWRDKLAVASRRQADYAWVILARVLSWGLNRGMVPVNPCEKGGRLYRGSRADKIWTEAEEALFRAKAPYHLHLPLTLALWTGQRQGDLLRLLWSAYDGKYIRLRQSKTGARVEIPVGAPLKTALDTAAKRKKSSAVILLNSFGKPWTADGFRSSWGKACVAAGIVDRTFHDLRGTAVTRLAIAGCTEAEIATLTGHSLRDVHAILDSNYLRRDPSLAASAIRKLEKRTDSSQ